MFKLEKKIVVKSKIVCTIGPATDSEEKLREVVAAGCNIMRLNFSHASADAKEMVELYNRIRKVDPTIGILCDIQGPKIRIGEIKDQVYLKTGDEYRIYVEDRIGDNESCSITHKGFLNDIRVGSFIYINDGLVRMVVEKINRDEGYADFKVTAGGKISSKKGVNIPQGDLSTENPTKKDKRDLKLIAKLNPEYVAASFVSKPSEVNAIRALLENEGGENIKIISKIERPIALENINEILAASDGIMVARGDLGVEIPAEDVPIWQKRLIEKCNRAGKPVIVATQMLESMITNPVPTRAEVNDIFNAISDRSDAVMLSGETSIGNYPIRSIEYMKRICAKSEKQLPQINPEHFDSDEQETFETAGHGIYILAKEYYSLGYRAKVVCFTRTGKTVRLTAKYRPRYPIIAISNDMKVARQLKLVWGVLPYCFALDLNSWDAERLIKEGLKLLVEYGALETTEHVIVSMASRMSPQRNSIIGLYYVEDVLKGETLEKKEYRPQGLF